MRGKSSAHDPNVWSKTSKSQVSMLYTDIRSQKNHNLYLKLVQLHFKEGREFRDNGGIKKVLELESLESNSSSTTSSMSTVWPGLSVCKMGIILVPLPAGLIGTAGVNTC